MHCILHNLPCNNGHQHLIHSALWQASMDSLSSALCSSSAQDVNIVAARVWSVCIRSKSCIESEANPPAVPSSSPSSSDIHMAWRWLGEDEDFFIFPTSLLDFLWECLFCTFCWRGKAGILFLPVYTKLNKIHNVQTRNVRQNHW